LTLSAPAYPSACALRLDQPSQIHLQQTNKSPLKPPSIVWQVAPSDTQDSSDPDESLSKLQAQLEVLQKKIEHQKRRKVARERRQRKELLKSRLVEMEAQIQLVKTELMELSSDEHEAEGGD